VPPPLTSTVKIKEIKMYKLKQIIFLCISLSLMLTSCSQETKLTEQQVADQFKQKMQEWIADYTTYCSTDVFPSIDEKLPLDEKKKLMTSYAIDYEEKTGQIYLKHYQLIKKLVESNGPYSPEITDVFTSTLGFLEAYGKANQLSALERKKGNKEKADAVHDKFHEVALIKLKKMASYIVKYDPSQKEEWDKNLKLFEQIF